VESWTDLSPDRGDGIVHEAPQRAGHSFGRDHAALKAAVGAEPDHPAHQPAEMKRSRVHQQPLEYVLVAAYKGAMEAPVS
jgi:hypothetical protein